jgi:hypothetical protein
MLAVQTGRSDAIVVGPPEEVPASGPAGERVEIDLPKDWRLVRLWAVDEAGNRSRAVKLQVPERFLRPFGPA